MLKLFNVRRLVSFWEYQCLACGDWHADIMHHFTVSHKMQERKNLDDVVEFQCPSCGEWYTNIIAHMMKIHKMQERKIE